MSWCWARTGLPLLALSLLAPVPARAQHGTELGLQGLATFADFDFVGGGVWVGWRPGGGTRFGLSLLGGAIDDELAGRAELVAHFVLSPGSQRGSPYAGAGLAGVAGSGFEHGYLMLALGYELKPGASNGWVIETGIGGGVRVLLGYRWRQLQR